MEHPPAVDGNIRAVHRVDGLEVEVEVSCLKRSRAIRELADAPLDLIHAAVPPSAASRTRERAPSPLLQAA
jgi:hypothetical protein